MNVLFLPIISIGFTLSITSTYIDALDEIVAAQGANTENNNRSQGKDAVGTNRSDQDLYYCGETNRCGGKFFEKHSHCHCDDLCLHFGDCCWNASPNRSAMLDVPPMDCVELEKGSMVFVVRNCPSDYGDAEVKGKCHKNISSDDLAAAVPVLDTSTKITYQNIFCAQCHNVSTAVTYNVSVTGFDRGCKPPDTSAPKDVLRHYLRENSTCSIEFKTESHIDPRYCFPDLLSTCSSNDSQLQHECLYGEFNPVYVYYASIELEIGFKNRYCHACNEEYRSQSSEPYYCYPQVPYDTQTRVLIDASRLFTNVQTPSVCGEGQIYDHIYVRYISDYSFFHLQRVWHASRERLFFRTHESVPLLGTCLCSNC